MDYVPQKITFGDKVTGNAKFIERTNMLAADTDRKSKDWKASRLANAKRRQMMAQRKKPNTMAMNALSSEDDT